jgi:nicotinamidase-related amidase
MGDKLVFEAARTAVLCMDYQNAIVAGYVGESVSDMLDRASGVLDSARAAGMQVIYIRVGFRPGLPEISPKNAVFSAIKNDPARMKMFAGEGQEIHPTVAPKENDVIVTKHRVGAFTGTDLEMILRSNEIDTLVLFGIATSGVVLSTLTQAFDADHRLFVIKDCCADRDQELHAALIDRYFPSRGKVITAAEFVTGIG